MKAEGGRQKAEGSIVLTFPGSLFRLVSLPDSAVGSSRLRLRLRCGKPGYPATRLPDYRLPATGYRLCRLPATTLDFFRRRAIRY